MDTSLIDKEYINHLRKLIDGKDLLFGSSNTTREQKMEFLKINNYTIVDNMVICGKVVNKNYGSIFNTIKYNKCGLYTDKTLLECYEEDFHKGDQDGLIRYFSEWPHGPGLWASSMEGAMASLECNKNSILIEVRYNIDDIICCGGDIKSWQFYVTNLSTNVE